MAGAYFWRWLHCLIRFHRAVTTWRDGTTTYIGCECGRCWYGTGWYDDWAEFQKARNN